MKRVLMALCVLLLGLAVSAAAQESVYGEVPWSAGAQMLYAQPDGEAQRALLAGEPLQLLEEKDNWLCVRCLKDGREETGYIRRESFMEVDEAFLSGAESQEGVSVSVGSGGTALLIAPQEGAAPIALLCEGAAFQVLGERDGYAFVDGYGYGRLGGNALRGYVRLDALSDEWGQRTVPLMRVQAKDAQAGVRSGAFFLMNGVRLSVFASSPDGSVAIGTSDLRLETLAVPAQSLEDTGEKAECFFEMTAIGSGVLIGDEDGQALCWGDIEDVHDAQAAVLIPAGTGVTILAQADGLVEAVLEGEMNRVFFLWEESIAR